ncbi:metal-dependent hydrolase [Pseudacidovorax sp. RU35E]|jgi:predicted metal-dependent hydrolase|uniref:metal-dependent hydrolase n=1 Tax=Pseudacidovorax sp. RU35E TaxID=1907403 RepID=UPI000955ADA4|nr:metal-dependent hydrolase [Pseudacidovorax sp. RU35E]SIQ15764.1 hypothetical protein SAMN05880557_102278 [Pseudacidovorax sp. RU35E]
MSQLVIRRLLIDLETPFERQWCAGNAFRTAFFNALSMSFPFGEQFFIDAVRGAVPMLSEDAQQQWQAEVRGFIGQEATHRRIHALFNGQLSRQGLDDHWTPRVTRRRKLLEDQDPRHALAITAATEHFTAIFADWLLRHPQTLQGVEPRLRTMWMWHAAEESEHKCTAFDLYRAVGGSEKWRRRWMRRVTTLFLSDLLRQTVSNLRHEKQLWKRSTWRDAWQTLMNRDGLLRSNVGAWRAYFRPEFHPSEQESTLAQQWLDANRGSYTPVGAN